VKEIVAVNGSIPATPTILTLGSGFSDPLDVAVDASGNVFVADYANSAVKKMVAVGGSIPASPTILTLGSGFSYPYGVAVDASGNVFVADTNNSAVKEISPANFGSIAVGATSAQQSLTFNFDTSGTLAATPYVVLTQGAANLDLQAAGTQPASVCIAGHTYNAGDSCTVDVTFTPTHPGERIGAVQLMGAGGVPLATGLARGIGTGPQIIFPSNNTPAALGSGFSYPLGVAVDASGDVFVVDYGNNAVKELVAVNGSIPTSPTILTLGSGLSYPTDVAVDASGDVFVAEYGNSAVKEMVAVGGSIPATPTILTLGSGFNIPTGVAVDASGDVFVVDYGNNAVKELVAVNGSIPASPTILTLGSGFGASFGVAVDASGNVFVADNGNSAVKEIVAVGGSIPASPTILTLGSGFSSPYGVAVEASGNVFVGDFGNNSVKELPYATAPALSFGSTPVGSTSSDSPQTVTVANDGNADLSFTVPITGLNPILSNNNFTFGSSSTCPQLDTSSSPATLAPGASCTDLISFSPNGHRLRPRHAGHDRQQPERRPQRDPDDQPERLGDSGHADHHFSAASDAGDLWRRSGDARGHRKLRPGRKLCRDQRPGND
jgi:streptogramin lyase